MGLTAGRFRERVTLQQALRVRDPGGATSDTWSDVVTVWASVEPLRGKEFFAADQMQEAVDYRVTIRYRTGVDRKMRVMWRGQALDVVSVIDVHSKRENIELMCISGVRNGR